jgi:hypothetical protein
MLTGADDDAWDGEGLSQDIAKQRIARQQAQAAQAGPTGMERGGAAVQDAVQGAKSGMQYGGAWGALGGAITGAVYGAATGNKGSETTQKAGKLLGVTGQPHDLVGVAETGKKAWDARTRTRNGVEFSKDDRGVLSSEAGDFDLSDDMDVAGTGMA